MDELFRKRTATTDEVDPSIKAETKMAMLIVQHNTFFNLSDHLAPFIRKEFKGSSVAESFQCGRTKTAAIVNCIGNYFFEKLKTDMKDLPFSLMLDASNDNGVEKMFPITVWIFDIEFNCVMTKFFDINLIEGRDSSTAACMFQSVDDMLVSNDIHWDYCMALGLDNTNVNIGDHNSIKTRAREKNESIIISGCPCQNPFCHGHDGPSLTASDCMQ